MYESYIKKQNSLTREIIKGPLSSIISKHFKNDFEMIRGPKVGLY